MTEEAKGDARYVLQQKGLPWGLSWLYAMSVGLYFRLLTIIVGKMLSSLIRHGFDLLSPVNSLDVLPVFVILVAGWRSTAYLQDKCSH